MSDIFSTVPLFSGLRTQGSTFYSFSGANNDTILLFSNTENIKMNFSKFACLKLPAWGNVAKQRLYKDPNDIKSINDTPGVDDANEFFVKAYLQNYVENFSTIVDASRQDITMSNFTEAAFWKALQSVSTDTNTLPDSYKTLQLLVDSEYQDINLVTRQKFKEVPTVANQYEQVVQWVGDINMLNHVKSVGKEYLEVYGHVPTGVGQMSDILFAANTGLDTNLSVVPPTGSGTDWVSGQQNAYENAQASAKTYARATYDNPDNTYNVNTELDILGIDWSDIESEQAKQLKYNKGNFEFNAILLYYDIWDANDPTTRKRNLYGILILDHFVQSSPSTEAIPSFMKYQPNANQAGNAFGFRFNLMFSSVTNQLTSEISINDYSTISMELYMAALQRLQTVSDAYSDLTSQMLVLSQDSQSLKQTILSLVASEQFVPSAYDIGEFSNSTVHPFVRTNTIINASNNFANDSAAAAGGIAINSLYHTDGLVKIRLA